MAEPPLEPPGDRVSSIGLRAGPQPESSVVVPNANSCRLVLPTNHRAGVTQMCRDRCVGRGNAAFTQPRGRRRRDAGQVDQVLQRNRNPVKRPEVTSGGDRLVRGPRRHQRLVGHDRDEGVEARVQLADDVERLFRDPLGRDLSAGDPRRKRRDRGAKRFNAGDVCGRRRRIRRGCPCRTRGRRRICCGGTRRVLIPVCGAQRGGRASEAVEHVGELGQLASVGVGLGVLEPLFDGHECVVSWSLTETATPSPIGRNVVKRRVSPASV